MATFRICRGEVIVMSLKPLLSFSSGELDPILHDRVTLQRFNKGLDTARNVMIGKTGSILSRFTRAHFVKAKNNNEAIKIISPPNSGKLTEWGPLYVRIYDFDGTLDIELAHTYTAADLEIAHFVHDSDRIYIFVDGKEPTALDYVGLPSPYFIPYGNLFATPLSPTITSVTPAGTPAGYPVEYLVTQIYNGQETLYDTDNNSGAGYNLPIASGQKNTLVVKMYPSTATAENFTELRVYRRPLNGGAFGFIGASTYFYTSGPDLYCDFEDLGGTADFTNNPPDDITKLGFNGDYVYNLFPKTGVIYQQRLLIGNLEGDEEGILASRPAYKNNFQRDYPYDADSALKFKAGTTGKADVLRMIDKDGLTVFTSVGVFINLGLLNINNVALEKKGSWVIDESVPPLAVPGGVFFVDKNTGGIRQFVYSESIGAYQAVEQSIFSGHLFKNKKIVSWGFQDGVVPLIVVVFSDGTFATFTFNEEHKMAAWTRHDSGYPIEQVAETGIADSMFFVTNKDGQRYIEVSLPRHIPYDEFISNPEADKLALNFLMDAAKTKSNLLNDSLTGSDTFDVTPVTPGDWEGNLTLTCGTSALFPSPGLGDVDTVFRFFDVNDKSMVDLTVVSRTSDNEVVVKPSAEFPSTQASDFRLYETFTQVTGLDHLEGEDVSVISDGYVLASPNNDIENYPTVTVSSGTITLPNSERGAIIVVGRPVVADTKTLNVSTVEQSPTTIESMSISKLYIRLNETRGLYVSNRFPEEKQAQKDGSSVLGMENLSRIYLSDEVELVGNRYDKPISKRIEQTIPGSWDSNGQISLRQVDPLHFEILSIISDIEIFNRR